MFKAECPAEYHKGIVPLLVLTPTGLLRAAEPMASISAWVGKSIQAMELNKLSLPV